MAAPKKAKKEVTEEKALNKREKMLALLEEEKKLASKSGESIKIGRLEDFSDTGRENYMLTNILGVDLNICGFKKGTFNVIYGAESSGKSTTALSAIEGIQMYKPDSVVLYVDTEQTISDTFSERMPYLNKENIFFLKEQIAEYAFNKILEYCKAGAVDYVVIDSVDTMVSKKEMEKNMEDAVMMEKARILSRALAEMTGYMAEFGITVIMIQQVRTNFTMHMQAVEGRSGGKVVA